MTAQKKEAKETKDSWLDGMNTDEIAENSQKDFLKMYDKIDSDDLETVRKVYIDTLPKLEKDVETKNGKQDLFIMKIKDSDVRYNVIVQAISTRRSLVALASKLSNAKTGNDIDMSKLFDKLVGLRREAWKDKAGREHKTLKFFKL